MTKEPEFIHVELPSGGTATVSANARPELLEALDEMLRLAAATSREESELETQEVQENCP
jgi:hypothetical protein